MYTEKLRAEGWPDGNWPKTLNDLDKYCQSPLQCEIGQKLIAAVMTFARLPLPYGLGGGFDKLPKEIKDLYIKLEKRKGPCFTLPRKRHDPS